MKKFAPVVLAVILTLALTGTAQAGEKGGVTTCVNGSVNAVHGEQQRLSMMTLKIAGIVVYRENAYSANGYAPNGGRKAWSTHADWLLWADSYGFCAPQYR